MSVRCSKAQWLLSASNPAARSMAKRHAAWTVRGDKDLLLDAASAKLLRPLRRCPKPESACPLRSDHSRGNGCEIADGRGTAVVRALLLEAALDGWRSERRPAGPADDFGSHNPHRPDRWSLDRGTPSERLRERVRRLRDEPTASVFPGVDDHDLDCALLAVEMLVSGSLDDPAEAVVQAAAKCGVRLGDKRSRRGRHRQRFDRLLYHVDNIHRSLGKDDR